MEKVFKWEAAKLKENIAQERMNDEGENEKYKDYQPLTYDEKSALTNQISKCSK